MGFFDKLLNGGDKKGGDGGGNDKKFPSNPLSNLKIGGPRKFQGQGQSLGGSKPGKVLEIVLPNPGPLGIKVGQSARHRAGLHVKRGIGPRRIELLFFLFATEATYTPPRTCFMYSHRSKSVLIARAPPLCHW